MWYNGSRQVKLAGLCCFMPSFFMHKLFSLVNTYRKNIEKKAVVAMVSKKARQVVYILCIVTIFITGGCTNRQTEHIGLQEPAPTGHTATMYVANVPTLSNVPVYRESGGLVWVPLEETAKSMNYDLHYANGCFAMGGTDAAYSVNMNQTRAMAGDMPVELPQAPKYIDHKPHLTTQALSALFGVPVNWNGEQSQVIFSPIDDRRLSDRQNTFPLEQSETETLRAAGISVNKNDLIRFAEGLVGTPYQFAAGPYESTHTFDCSSFVQYVYGHFGIKLPRSSRAQAEVGQSVSVNQLQPGDLLFFYTPGRFASNQTVGHVGIYAGNGQIIHTYGDPGVTLTEFDTYWRNRFLFAKRVV